MDLEFWKKAWVDGRTAFHQGQTSPHLVRHLPLLNIKENDHILLPLCGKTLDLLYLQDMNLKVTGIEISELAIEQFQAEHPREYKRAQKNNFTVYQNQKLEIWNGDFFEFHSEITSPIHYVFDRAAMVALPFELRKQYAQKLCEFLKLGAKLLLVTFEYPQEKVQGPPFSVTRSEVEIFYKEFKVQEIYREAATVTGPKFVEAGINQVENVCYLIG